MSLVELLEEKVKNILADIREGPIVGLDDLPPLLDAIQHPGSVNDRLLLQEKLLVIMTRLGDSSASPAHRKIASTLQGLVIDFLYKDLPHPPGAYLSALASSSADATTAPAQNAYVKYAYREADGSNYNPLIPGFGAARQPYARSVPSTSLLTPINTLPDPGLIFDTLFRRPKDADGKSIVKEHPSGVSSCFFALADLIIHDIFNTDRKDWSINDNSSYLDLSVLYGSSDKQVDSLRRHDGTGRLWDDVFADSRLLFMPPATCAMLVLFNRNHNFIAEKILSINERGNLKPVSSLQADPVALKAQDDELFHRARLVNSAYYTKIILGDYVGAILGQVRDRRNWRLDPLVQNRTLSHNVSPRGEGNVCSIEFNLLYRWHATLSETNERWTENEFKNALKAIGMKDEQIDFNTITPEMFGRAVATAAAGYKPENVREWTFGGIERQIGEDGKPGAFSSADIARILIDATADRASAYGARNIPEVLKVIEVMGIQQARSWGACSMNEFREFFGLKRYGSFTEWNPDPAVAKAAKVLYKDIDNLELYVGLQAEATKQPGPGAGLCPGYTISRSILADAVCLTRGDRFLTTECTPYNLTTYGYRNLLPSTAKGGPGSGEQDGSYGGNLTRLLFRHFPAHYPPRSAYAHFPFLQPQFMKAQVEELDKERNTKEAGKYIWDRPPVPKGPAGVSIKKGSNAGKEESGVEKVIGSYEAVKQILDATDTGKGWTSGNEERIKAVLGTSRMPDLTLERQLIQQMDPHPSSFLGKEGQKYKNLTEYFGDLVKALVDEKSITHADADAYHDGQKGHKGGEKYVDVVRDVINLVPVRWICQQVAGIPFVKDANEPSELDGDHLETEKDEDEVWTEEELERRFGDVCQYVYANLSPVEDWQLRESSTKLFKYFSRHVVSNLRSNASWFGSVTDAVNTFTNPNAHTSHPFLHKLWEKRGNKTFEELAAALFVETVITARHWSQAVSHAVNGILRADGVASQKDIAEVKKVTNQALANDPILSGVYRTALQDTAVGNAKVVAGERVFVSLIEANKSRPKDAQGILGVGEYGLLSYAFFDTITPQVIKTILSLPGLKRAPGQSGKFNRFTENTQTLGGAPQQIYIDADGALSPFPDSLVVQYNSA